jgi:hypothetical protein
LNLTHFTDHFQHQNLIFIKVSFLISFFLQQLCCLAHDHHWVAVDAAAMAAVIRHPSVLPNPAKVLPLISSSKALSFS